VKKLLPERKREKPQIILTNLIDVILLLVFFFMITSSFAKDSKKVPIDLPHASSAVAIDGETLKFQADKDGNVIISGQIIDLENISSKVADYLAEDRSRSILVEADKELNYGRVIQILDLIRTAGGINIGLSTRPGSEK